MPDKEPNHDDETNPFVAFRRFADDGISAVFAGLSELPSLLGNAVKGFEVEQKRQLPRQRNQQYGNAEEHDTLGAPYPDPKAPYDGQSTLYQKIDRHLTKRCMHFHTPEFLIAETPDWHPFFFVKHPYSPLQLERDPTTRNIGIPWRDACEDLLLVERDMPMPHRGDEMEAVGSENSPKGWIVGLIYKGLTSLGRLDRGKTPWLPPDQNMSRSPQFHHLLHNQLFCDEKLPVQTMSSDEGLARLRLFDTIAETHDRSLTQSGEAASKIPWSDLNAYDEFLDCLCKGLTSSQDQEQPTVSHTSASPRPSIISTLTKTQRNVAPDGTVTTKTVTKRRFADGNEESDEMTDTVPGTKPGRNQFEPDNVGDAMVACVVAEPKHGREKQKEKGIKKDAETQKETGMKKDVETRKDDVQKKQSNWFWSSW